MVIFFSAILTIKGTFMASICSILRFVWAFSVVFCGGWAALGAVVVLLLMLAIFCCVVSGVCAEGVLLTFCSFSSVVVGFSGVLSSIVGFCALRELFLGVDSPLSS